jgi:hypothetical protein
METENSTPNKEPQPAAALDYQNLIKYQSMLIDEYEEMIYSTPDLSNKEELFEELRTKMNDVEYLTMQFSHTPQQKNYVAKYEKRTKKEPPKYRLVNIKVKIELQRFINDHLNDDLFQNINTQEKILTLISLKHIIKRLQAFDYNPEIDPYPYNYEAEIDKHIEQLKQSEAPATTTNVIKWKLPKNALYQMFYDLLDCGAIETTKTNLAKVIFKNFGDKYGNELGFEAIVKGLKPRVNTKTGFENSNAANTQIIDITALIEAVKNKE